METATLTQYKKDQASGKSFTAELPENTRVATLDDFYKDNETDLEPELIIGKPFLVHSYKDGLFWASRTTTRFPYRGTDFMRFLEAGRIYVFEL